jgi:hypothetical protein
MSWSFTVLALLLAFTSAGAQDRLDAVAAAADRATAAAEAPAVERMARFLATTPEALRAERASAGLGWGDLFLSHRIASRSGHPIEKVFAARRTGAPWGDIVSDAGVDPELLVQDVASVWPEAAGARPAAGGAARAVPPTAAPAGGPVAAPAGAPPAEAKGFGGRLLDVLRGAPEGSSGDAPADRTSEEIRDRMIRGGGTRPR